MRSPSDEDGTPPELRSGCGQPTFVQPFGQEQRSAASSSVVGAKISHSNRTGQPFFNGKLILREVANGNGAAAAVGVPSCQGVPPTRTSPPGNIDSTSAIGTNGHPLIPMSTGAMTLAPPLNNARSTTRSNTSTRCEKGLAGSGVTGTIPKIKMPSPAANIQITDDLIPTSKCGGGSDETDETEEEEEDSSDDTVYECPGMAASLQAGEELVVTNPFFTGGSTNRGAPRFKNTTADDPLLGTAMQQGGICPPAVFPTIPLAPTLSSQTNVNRLTAVDLFNNEVTAAAGNN